MKVAIRIGAAIRTGATSIHQVARSYGPIPETINAAAVRTSNISGSSLPGRIYCLVSSVSRMATNGMTKNTNMKILVSPIPQYCMRSKSCLVMSNNLLWIA